MNKNKVGNVVTKFNQCTKDSNTFLGSSTESDRNKMRTVVKDTYDVMVGFTSRFKTNLEVPKELVVVGLDDEQIWQQMEVYIKSEKSKYDTETLMEACENLKPNNNDEEISESTDGDDDNDENDDELDYSSAQSDKSNNSSGDENSVSIEDDDGGDDESHKNDSDIEYEDFFGDRNQKYDADAEYEKLFGEKGSKNIVGDEKSSFEIRQERVKKRIDELEQEALSEKPWQMKGEISAKKRPENALLEEVLDFDLTTRPAPIVTQEVSMKLDDMILKRIKDKVWDDVERKIKPIDTPYEFKKKLVLNQEKSKQSLSQIYEQEYLKQKEKISNNAKESVEQEEPEQHKRIKSLMGVIFKKLDALSNFHFTPQPAVPTLKIVNNLPAVCMEEAAPVSTSDAMLLAPEEIQAKKQGIPIAKEERTSTDKKRERRKKKLRQHIKQKAIEEKQKALQRLNKNGQKHCKEKLAKELEQLLKNKQVKRLDEQSQDVTSSSKKLFSYLQNETINNNNNNHKSKKPKARVTDPKKIKL